MIASHCFAAPGDFTIKLDLIDKNSGKFFFSKLSYDLKIKDYEQPYINSSDVAVKGETIVFDGRNSYLPGYTTIAYSWNFGDGTRSLDEMVKHGYREKGEYSVNLGLTLKSDSTGKISRTGISKKIVVFTDSQGVISYKTEKDSEKTKFIEPGNFENVKITPQFSAENDFRQAALFVVELVTSKNRISFNNSELSKIPKKFRITEKFDKETEMFSYTVDEEMNLMATYPAFREMSALGFKDVRIKINLLESQSEKELHNLIRINGAFADSYFDSSEKLTANAYVMLDQILKLMKKYPPMKLELAVHTDSKGIAENNLLISQRHSQDMVDYLIKRGISTKRIVAVGFGATKPIAPNFLEKDRKLNRRIDFTIIN